MGALPRIDDIKAPPKIFRQRADGTFEDASAITGFNLVNAEYFLLSDLSGDGSMDLVARSIPNDFTVYDTTSLPFKDITSATIPSAIPANDVAIADFNGDLRPDLYLTRSSGSVTDLYQSTTNKAIALLVVKKEEKGFQFDTSDAVTFDILNYFNGKFSIPLSQVYIGANGIHPANWKFTLSPQDPNVRGILPHEPGVDRGIYIGYDFALQRWQLLLSSSDQTIISENILDENKIIAYIETTKPISQLTAVGFQADPPARDAQLLINTGAGFIDQSELAGINSIPTRGYNVAAGDFDNDMDQDIYIVASRLVVNSPDILYENQGDGTFVAIPDSAGAAGTEIGVGDFVTTADYDVDGFLDLLVANGRGQKSLLNANALYELYHNQGNSNHWLEIDLQGLVSNRDGIGAQVFLTAGGVTQLREQSGGIHNQVQNHQRIHFGLADNTIVQELVINWPSGRVQVVKNIPVDQLIRITEPAAIQIDQAVKYGTVNWNYDTAEPFSDVDSFIPVRFNLSLASGNPLPAWILFNTNTGLITGTPSLTDRGTFALIVTATDSKGSSINTPLTIAVTMFDMGQLLVSTTGNDMLRGTLSNDTASYANAIAPVLVSLAISNQQNTMAAGLDTLTNIDNLMGSIYNDSLTGHIQDNILDGGVGNDTLNGKAGNDTLHGGIGADTMIGGLGDDTFIVNSVSDLIIENLNEGIDKIYSNVTYTLSANVENLTLTEISAINGTGNNLANILIGNAAHNHLNGGIGNDTLNGAGGADGLIGGAGNDSYVIDNTSDVIAESLNEGTDSVSSNVTYTLSANVENLTLTGASLINGTGNNLANILTGNAMHNHLSGGIGNDTLNGAIGADELIGGLGNDSYVVDNGFESITENLNEGTDNVSSNVTYALSANVENLALTGASVINGTGNNLANILIGNVSNNILSGGAGNDTLDGSTGTNTLTGGIGNDNFKFTSMGHTDTITDYNVTNDTIQLENAVFMALATTGTLLASQFRVGTQALDANDFIIYNNATGKLLYDADGEGAIAAIQIAMLGLGLAMTNTDIMVI